jgi:PhnB protein
MSSARIPPDYHTVTPYLIVKGVAEALEFYRRALGAVETMRLESPDGSIAHAEMRVGDSPIMLGEEMGALYRGPQAYGGTPVSLMVYVENCDAVIAGAVEAGGQIVRPVADQFYGDRCGTIVDPFGHLWSIATHVEDVPAEEMHRRFHALLARSEP